MYRIVDDITNSKNRRENISIGGKSEQKKEEVLRKGLQRLRQYNVKFNRDKCEINKEHIAFLATYSQVKD